MNAEHTPVPRMDEDRAAFLAARRRSGLADEITDPEIWRAVTRALTGPPGEAAAAQAAA